MTELTPMDVTGRVPRVRARLAEAECDGLLVTELANVRYLTGFTGSAAVLLVTSDDLLFVSDGRYGEQATHQLRASGVPARIEISSTGQKEILAGAVERLDRLGLEAGAVTWAQQRRYDDDWFPDATLVATEGVVEGLREFKDEGEVARIEAAARIADAALGQVRTRLLDRPSEREFGLELDTAVRRLGAQDTSFETIVASGPNGALPHHRPADRTIVEGDLVVLDFGALVDGYCSDMTRTVMVGEPTSTQARMLEVVAASQQAGVEAVADGVEATAVDRACREVIEAEGWADAFVHGTGHGVGLLIHEAPRVSATSTATLHSGHVVTVEPGVYLPEHGGVRVEDTVVVTGDGCRALTLAPKEPALAA